MLLELGNVRQGGGGDAFQGVTGERRLVGRYHHIGEGLQELKGFVLDDGIGGGQSGVSRGLGKTQ